MDRSWATEEGGLPRRPGRVDGSTARRGTERPAAGRRRSSEVRGVCVAPLPLRGGRRTRPTGVGSALALLVAVLALGAAAPARAQTILVSNTGEAQGGGSVGTVMAQAFTTGSHPSGYRLASVSLVLAGLGSQVNSSDTHVAVWSDDAGEPDAEIAALTSPSLAADAINVFAAPDDLDLDLDPDTTYHVVVNRGLETDARVKLKNTGSDSETSDHGWTIADDRHWSNSLNPTSWSVSAQELVMQLEGEQLVSRDAIPADWSLKPDAVGAGGRFRLLFVSSTVRTGDSTDIADYNTHVQGAAAAGHADIQAFADEFTAVGSTATVNVRLNTLTRAEDTDAPIYWVVSTATRSAVADDYADFYDEDWGDTFARTETGAAAGLSSGRDAITGSLLDGATAGFPLGGLSGFVQTWYLSGSSVRTGAVTTTDERRLLGLSPIFRVAGGASDATLSGLELTDSGGNAIELDDTFAPDVLAYAATVANAVVRITVTATSTDATIAYKDGVDAALTDADPDADGFQVDLVPGDNVVRVEVTVAGGAPTTYAVTVNRGTTVDPVAIPADWSLKPDAVAAGGRFRLLFASSATRTADSSDIADYNGHVQAAAAAGHVDIQAFADEFTVVGSTLGDNVRQNTLTRAADTDAPIYWVEGSATRGAVADDYADFYDGTWDNPDGRTEAGAAISLLANPVATGSLTSGATAASALGGLNGFVTGWAVSDSGVTIQALDSTAEHSLLGLSAVLRVAAEVPAELEYWSATLTIGEPNGESGPEGFCSADCDIFADYGDVSQETFEIAGGDPQRRRVVVRRVLGRCRRHFLPGTGRRRIVRSRAGAGSGTAGRGAALRLDGFERLDGRLSIVDTLPLGSDGRRAPVAGAGGGRRGRGPAGRRRARVPRRRRGPEHGPLVQGDGRAGQVRARDRPARLLRVRRRRWRRGLVRRHLHVRIVDGRRHRPCQRRYRRQPGIRRVPQPAGGGLRGAAPARLRRRVRFRERAGFEQPPGLVELGPRLVGRTAGACGAVGVPPGRDAERSGADGQRRRRDRADAGVCLGHDILHGEGGERRGRNHRRPDADRHRRGLRDPGRDRHGADRRRHGDGRVPGGARQGRQHDPGGGHGRRAAPPPGSTRSS